MIETEPTIPPTFSDLLSDLKAYSGMSQAEMAEGLIIDGRPTTQQSISRWMQGYGVGISARAPIASALGIDYEELPDDFFEGTKRYKQPRSFARNPETEAAILEAVGWLNWHTERGLALPVEDTYKWIERLRVLPPLYGSRNSS